MERKGDERGGMGGERGDSDKATFEKTKRLISSGERDNSPV